MDQKIWGRFHKLFFALRPTFEMLFTGVEHALRLAPIFNRAVSMICAVRPTFMKSTPVFKRDSISYGPSIVQMFHLILDQFNSR